MLTKEKSKQKRKSVNIQNNSVSYFRICNTGEHHHHDNNQLRNKKSGPKNGQYYPSHLQLLKLKAELKEIENELRTINNRTKELEKRKSEIKVTISTIIQKSLVDLQYKSIIHL